ncbi:MAG: BMP family ABC transporter substrate-binding protein [Anaerolineae bacterium]
MPAPLRHPRALVWLLLTLIWLAGCAQSTPTPLPLPTLEPARPQVVGATPTGPAPTAAAPLPTAIYSPTLRVGLVTDGGLVDDGSLNQSAYAGMQRAAAETDIAVDVIESVEAGDFGPNLAVFANQSYDVIITIGNAAGAAAQQMAAQYPASRFVVLDPTDDFTAPDLTVVRFDETQLGYLAGALAGLTSQKKTVGIVVGPETPEHQRLLEGYRSGVLAVCDACAVLVTPLDSADDAGRGRTAALRQVGEGADVVFGVGGATGGGALLAAAQQKAWAVGVDVDAYATLFQNGEEAGADHMLGSAVKRADNAVYQLIQDALADKPLPASLSMDAASAGISLIIAPSATLPAAAQAGLDKVLAQLASGQLPVITPTPEPTVAP